MNWPKPILTDSGGYQVLVWHAYAKIKDDGVEFNSHIDRRAAFFYPEDIISIQKDLGSDIMMPLDECVPYRANTPRPKKPWSAQRFGPSVPKNILRNKK